MKRGVLLILCFAWVLTTAAREPLYVVNGEVVAGIENIPQEDIESIDILPANEETIADWGMEASEGVILVQLRYDTRATFSIEGYNNFTTWLTHNVRWDSDMPAERVSLRLTIDASGKASVGEVLETTSRTLLKRVSKAISTAPKWQPAMRNGTPCSSYHLVNLQLPEGKERESERAVIIL